MINLPKCIICGRELSNYGYKRCLFHNRIYLSRCLIKRNKTNVLKGKDKPNFGVAMSNKQKEKIKISCKNYWKKFLHPWKNKKHKQSSKNKIKLFQSEEKKIYNVHGYVLIWNSTDKIKRKRVLEHRYVVERVINRKLKSTEIVHHINEIKDDNRTKNLYLFKSQMEHCAYTVLKRTSSYLIKNLKSNLKDIE